MNSSIKYSEEYCMEMRRIDMKVVLAGAFGKLGTDILKVLVKEELYEQF